MVTQRCFLQKTADHFAVPYLCIERDGRVGGLAASPSSSAMLAAAPTYRLLVAVVPDAMALAHKEPRRLHQVAPVRHVDAGQRIRAKLSINLLFDELAQTMTVHHDDTLVVQMDGEVVLAADARLLFGLNWLRLQQ